MEAPGKESTYTTGSTVHCKTIHSVTCSPATPVRWKTDRFEWNLESVGCHWHGHCSVHLLSTIPLKSRWSDTPHHSLLPQTTQHKRRFLSRNWMQCNDPGRVNMPFPYIISDLSQVSTLKCHTDIILMYVIFRYSTPHVTARQACNKTRIILHKSIAILQHWFNGGGRAKPEYRQSEFRAKAWYKGRAKAEQRQTAV